MEATGRIASTTATRPTATADSCRSLALVVGLASAAGRSPALAIGRNLASVAGHKPGAAVRRLEVADRRPGLAWVAGHRLRLASVVSHKLKVAAHKLAAVVARRPQAVNRRPEVGPTAAGQVAFPIAATVAMAYRIPA